jgi:hypothetical protein
VFVKISIKRRVRQVPHLSGQKPAFMIAAHGGDVILQEQLTASAHAIRAIRNVAYRKDQIEVGGL